MLKRIPGAAAGAVAAVALLLLVLSPCTARRAATRSTRGLPGDDDFEISLFSRGPGYLTDHTGAWHIRQKMRPTWSHPAPQACQLDLSIPCTS